MATDRDRKAQERENLRNIIAQWNANRLDLFELSEPNEDLEFHGVMRFYFQDAGQKVATKCIRVASTATTQDCIHTLIEKFRPDIRMLSVPEYALYEIHENGDERQLAEDEKPLLVQLNWHKDDREGRFLLRRMDEKSHVINWDVDSNQFKRKLSKREKKEKKKREKKERMKGFDENKKDGIAERLYSELPETSFTRSISNPEAVMRRRRQQKLEKRLQQLCQEGGAEGGGTLRVFGETLNRDVPYKTLLLSTKDTAAFVVKEMLDKYGKDKEDPSQYCLVQAILPPNSYGEGDLLDIHAIPGIREYILDDDDCPLLLEKQHNGAKGILTFHVKRRPADYQPRKRKKKPKPVKGDAEAGYKYEDTLDRLPYLLELNTDGNDVLRGTPKKHCLYLNVTEVGSERSASTNGQYLQLFGPNVQPRHCVIAHTEGIVTVTPSSRDAETYVNGVRIYETTILQHGMVVRFGKLHTFRFIDPLQDERRQLSSDPPRPGSSYNERIGRKEDQTASHPVVGYETTFDAEGNVETISTHSRDDRMSRKSDDAHSHRSFGKDSTQSSRAGFERPRGNDPILPAVLQFLEDGEDAFLNAVISQMDPVQVQFKLAPTYVLYMAARYRASTHFRPETTPSDRAHRLTALMNKVAGLVHQVIQDRFRDATSLAFWLANASELLHFLKQDRHLSAYTLDAQDLLAESVQLAFRSLVTCQQGELQTAMPSFLEDSDEISDEDGTSEVLSVLSSAMSLLRRCRVNAALTIQLFSQLFHFINMWLFNKVVCEPHPNFCTRLWGARLKMRLMRVESWAEKQGLELAADCHLSRIVQAAHLLQAPKSNLDDIAAISSTCFKLNSLQLRSLLEKYQPVPEEPRIPRDLVDSVVKVAESTADEIARSDGREVRLEEEPDLQLPFLLPEDGYSCDIVRGVPAGLQEFLQPLVHSGLCRLTIQPSSSGYWTIYMSDQDIGRPPPTRNQQGSPNGHGHPSGEPEMSSQAQPPGGGGGGGAGAGGRASTVPPSSACQGGEPEVVTIKLQKSNNGMGLSIVAARGVGQDKLGIYIKSVVKGGAADVDGRLQAGDQLLKVDGQSLVGITQEKAAELMTQTGPVVTLEVAKQGAIYHGLAALLSQPSPVMQRGSSHGGGGRRLSERDIPSRLMHDPRMANHLMPPRIQGSKSVPALNSGHPNHQEPLRAPSSNNLQSHEVYNPGYSRTSSTTSIPKAMQGYINNSQDAARAHSTTNLCQDQPPHEMNQRYPYPPPMPPQGSQAPPPYSVAGGGPPQQNFQQPMRGQLPPEERHYQNISLYQQQPNNYGARPSPQPYLNPPPHLQAPRGHHGSHSSLQHSDHFQSGGQPQMDRVRPVSALVSPREQEQYANSMGYPHTLPPQRPPPSPHRVQPPPYSLEPQGQQTAFPQRVQELREYRSQHDVSHYQDGEQQQPGGMEPPQQGGHPPRGYHQESYAAYGGPSPGHPHGMDLRHRDLMRQEAKMEEMREEVRRREERERSQQNLGQPSWGQPPRSMPSSTAPARYGQANNYGTNSPHYGPPPQHPPRGPTVPPPPPPTSKPRVQLPGEKPLRTYPYDPRYEGQAMHPVYRDSPPPGMPPGSAHPLHSQPGSHLQQQPIGPPPPAVSYRYGPSGYPPRPNEAPNQRPNQSLGRPAGGPPGPETKQLGPGYRHSASSNSSSNQRLTGPSSGTTSDSQMQQEKKELLSPSPWEREEKEKMCEGCTTTLLPPPTTSPLLLQQQRLEEARRARDEEISELEEQPHRTLKQEERLRTLRLEQEFQRRAEESKGDDDEDDDEELLDRAENRERMLRMQEDLERTRQRRIEWEQSQLRQQQQKVGPPVLQPRQQEDWPAKHNNNHDRQRSQLEEQEGRLRHLRLEEVTRKQELQAAKEAEERLLREARRRQEEDLKNQRNLQVHSQLATSTSHPYAPSGQQPSGHHRLESLISGSHQDVPPPLPLSPPPPLEPVPNSGPGGHLHYTNPSAAHSSGAQRLDKLLLTTAPASTSSHPSEKHSSGPPPPPPERKSSYEVTNHMTSHMTSGPRLPSSLRNGDSSQVHVAKKVSWNDTRFEVETNGNSDSNGGQASPSESDPRGYDASASPPNYNNSDSYENEDSGFTLEDIDEVLSTPGNSHSHQLNTYSTGSTPGVIGAQEVYRDPRQRIEAERQQMQQQEFKSAGPEKLSFREKMKMFAKETGEPNSPRDRMKISRAQRDIENNLNGT